MIQLEDKLYTSTEVADILGVSLRSVYRYLEEDKLKAEVKTATGRHRFSKKNILDFLYPDGSSEPVKLPQEDIQPKPQVVKKAAPKQQPVEPKKKVEIPVEEIEEEQYQTKVEEERVEEVKEEEPIDWLAKFREAAKKYREEAEATAAPHTREEVEAPMSMADTKQQAAPVRPAPRGPAAPEKHYYRSSLGGLKDIAQNIDRGSRNSFLDYAFTLNAGLSLYKPIKPFSMLHAYVRPGDLSFYEKLLGLTPTDESNSQLCLLLSEDGSIYASKEELHGLFVVSRERLLADIQNLGDSSLLAEASGILK